MRIKYVVEDGIAILKNNSEFVYKNVIEEGRKTLAEVLGDSSLIKETPYEIESITLDMSQPKGKETLTDAENAQRVYSHMKSLSDSQASDERIWIAYTLQEQLEYMKYRWDCKNGSEMLNRYFFNYSSNRSLFRNGISRLWWIGRVTYDETRTDPFELTKFLCSDQDLIETICGRSIFNNPVVQRATIEAIYDEVKNGKSIKRETVREVAKYVNLLSGTYLLDMLTHDEVYGKVHAKICELVEG